MAKKFVKMQGGKASLHEVPGGGKVTVVARGGQSMPREQFEASGYAGLTLDEGRDLRDEYKEMFEGVGRVAKELEQDLRIAGLEQIVIGALGKKATDQRVAFARQLIELVIATVRAL